MLLHSCVLQPSGPANIAAIRFTTPVRVQNIRIYKTGSQPFSQIPEIIAKTEPEAFFLEVFLNAAPIHTGSEGKQKQKAQNALVPSVIAYAGGQMDFKVNIEPASSTRLMILKGPFKFLSLAIYGDVVSELPPPPTIYEPKPVSVPDIVPLSRSLDPSNMMDPTWLAQELLALIPDSPPLPLVIRTMLCLKPTNEDWDLPEFPYLHMNVEDEIQNMTVESAFDCTTRSVADDSSLDSLEKFADALATATRETETKQTEQIAGIISHAASQHPDLARVLMEKLDFEHLFQVTNLDENVLDYLLDAVTNVTIARTLGNPWFSTNLQILQDAPTADQYVKAAAKKVAQRIRDWQIFEDALSNTQADFNAAAKLMTDIGKSEHAFGIWLESMITQPELLTKLVENPVLPMKDSRPPVLIGQDPDPTSHDEFIAYVRAYIGVASTLAVYAWSDSIPDEWCRERTLGVIRLWQGVDGYREIVNHLMLLRQMTFRLECMTTDNDPPTPSGVHAEHILLSIAQEPISMHTHAVVKCILSLKQPLSVISEDERLALREAALIADDDIGTAIQELTVDNTRPLHLHRIRLLRVAVSTVQRELENENGEWAVLEALWEDKTHGLVLHLVDVLQTVSEDLQSYFAIAQPPISSQELVKLLFLLSQNLLMLIGQLSPAYPLTSRLTRIVVVTLADVFVCTDAADLTYAQSSPVSRAAHRTRQACMDLIRALGAPLVYTDSGRLASEVVLRALLDHALHSGTHDPAYHLLQVFCLIDHLLPASIDAAQSHWVNSTLPNVLSELHRLFRALDKENKLHFMKRLVGLDQGTTGIGEWVLLEELKELLEVLHSLQDAMVDDQYYSVAQFQVSTALQFLTNLFVKTSTLSAWSLASLTFVIDLAQMLSRCCLLMLDNHIESPMQVQLINIVISESTTLDPDLKFASALILLRSLQCPNVSYEAFKASFPVALKLLKEMSTEYIDEDRLHKEMGATFSAISDSESALKGFDAESADIILSALDWLPERDLDSVTDVGSDPFVKLATSMLSILSPGRTDAVAAVRNKLHGSDDATMNDSTSDRTLPERIQLSLDSLSELLQPPNPTPSTPKLKPQNPDVLGLVTLSPPTALLRSPNVITGLTKTYLNNDFRQLRQLPSALQNTSRLPSMHVDGGYILAN